MNIILMGVSGSGKTTIGMALVARLGPPWRFDDGDDFHPRANIEKMSHGIPLDDADRAPWLAALHAHLEACAARGENVVLACSALKATYRAELTGAGHSARFVYLKGSFDLLLSRLQARQHHYMKAAMLRSQFEALEEPGPDEATTVDVARPSAECVEGIVRALDLAGGAAGAAPR